MISRIDPANLSPDQINDLCLASDVARKRNRRRLFCRAPNDTAYKRAMVDFVKSQPWHWFITIPIGRCDNDDSVLRRVRTIEAILCGKYLTKRYRKLPRSERFSLLVAFEGERRDGERHAHMLAYLPKLRKRCVSHAMLMSSFPREFGFLLHKLEPKELDHSSSAKVVGNRSNQNGMEWWLPSGKPELDFKCFTPRRATYTVKHIRLKDVPWSRLEFVTPPRFKKFDNENLSVIRNRNRQKRQLLGLH